AGIDAKDASRIAYMSSLPDETPEGRSIVALAQRAGVDRDDALPATATFVPFSAYTRMSGVDMNGTQLRKGAPDAILNWVRENGGQPATELAAQVERIARGGGTPLLLARDKMVLGAIHLKDILKPNMRER